MKGKQWYDENILLNIFWFITIILWLPIYIVCYLISKIDEDFEIPEWVKWWGNRVDNLFDQIKEAIHCWKIPYSEKIWPSKWPNGLQFNISVIMKNREPKTWDIIRPHGCYSNCDPEDCACKKTGDECVCEDCSNK